MGLRVVRVGVGEDGEGWVRALEDGEWVGGAEVLKRDGGVAVWRARVMGRDVVVKRWGLTRVKRRVQAVFDATPGCRHWLGAERLKGAGILTAEPFVLARGRDAEGPCEVLVMSFVHGRSVLEHVAHPSLPVRAQHDLARCIGRHITQSVTNGCINDDGKGSNLLVVERQGTFEICVIDCGAITGNPDDEPQVSLARLAIEMIGVGHPPRRALAMRAVTSCLDASWWPKKVSRRERRNEIWRSALGFIARHGDPTPKVDPLRR